MNRHIRLTTALRVIAALVSCSAVHAPPTMATRCGDISAPCRATSSRMPTRSVSATTRLQNASNGFSQPGSACSTAQPRSFSNTAAARAAISRISGSTAR
jgi:hypothetical protein